jgi:hypothetical protein
MYSFIEATCVIEGSHIFAVSIPFNAIQMILLLDNFRKLFSFINRNNG